MEIDRVIPGRERLPEVRVHHVRLAFLEARQTSPMPAALYTKAAGDPRPEAFCAGDFPDKVHLSGLFMFLFGPMFCVMTDSQMIFSNASTRGWYTPVLCARLRVCIFLSSRRRYD